MSYEEFVKEYLRKGLLQKLNTDWSAIKKLMLRSEKDLKAAKLNFSIDAGMCLNIMLGRNTRYKIFQHSDLHIDSLVAFDLYDPVLSVLMKCFTSLTLRPLQNHQINNQLYKMIEYGER
jgi:hypothetical protein